jgi:hypothetical protein
MCQALDSYQQYNQKLVPANTVQYGYPYSVVILVAELSTVRNFNVCQGNWLRRNENIDKFAENIKRTE